MESHKGSDILTLHAMLHPSMHLPKDITFDPRDLEFQLPATAKVDDLMEACEDMFFGKAKSLAEPVELVINVLWNSSNPKKALNPADPLKLYFKNEDTFGVHGDIMPAESEPPEILEKDKIPITILTGFLGSGKTTLLNYILREQHEKKIAVIENEFGEVAIDDALLKREKLATAEQIVVLDNGCMCCTVRGDLEVGLINILDACKENGRIDALIIETTGLADPVPIVRTIKQMPRVMSYFRLDAVVAVADAKHLLGRLFDTVCPMAGAEIDGGASVNEAYQQIAFADRVLLNKIDLVEAEQVMEVKETIRQINRLAKVIPSVRAQIKLEDIMNVNAHSLMNFSEDDFVDDELSQLPFAKPAKGGYPNDTSDDTSGQSSKKMRHSDKVTSFSIVREGEISQMLLNQFIGLLQQPPPSKGLVLRFKAILALKEMKEKMVIHAVQDVVEHDLLGEWLEDEQRVCKMVFIGKQLDQKYFRSVFDKVVSF